MAQVAANKRHSTSDTIFCLPKPNNVKIKNSDSLLKNHVKNKNIFVGGHSCPWKDVVNSASVQLALCVTSHIENLVSPLLTSKLRVR